MFPLSFLSFGISSKIKKSGAPVVLVAPISGLLYLAQVFWLRGHPRLLSWSNWEANASIVSLLCVANAALTSDST